MGEELQMQHSNGHISTVLYNDRMMYSPIAIL